MPPHDTPSPVIVAARGALTPPFPILEGRHRQPLPMVPGRWRGALRAGTATDGEPGDCADEQLNAWLVPWRVGSERSLCITLKPGTDIVVDVSGWPERGADDASDSAQGPRSRVLRRAARILEQTPGAFSTVPSVSAGFERLEAIWNESKHDQSDPLGDLLARHANRLRVVLEDLGSRPRSVLRTRHRMLKLQDARRIDSKTLRWLSAQPGRNTAERAGARQRVKAPKRYETIVTLENRVLRAFASLTVRETRNWLASRNANDQPAEMIEAHQLRARRIEAMLRRRNVPEAIPPVMPNFPLRFDQRYRQIWRAWQQLLRWTTDSESEWMWQNRTFMELLGIRAAMKLHEAVEGCPGGGILAQRAILGATGVPSQGCYLNKEGVRCTFGVTRNNALHAVEFESGDHGFRLGAIAAAGCGAEVWWHALDALDSTDTDVAVGELPWSLDHAWDESLRQWAAQVIAK